MRASTAPMPTYVPAPLQTMPRGVPGTSHIAQGIAILVKNGKFSVSLVASLLATLAALDRKPRIYRFVTLKIPTNSP